MEYAVKICYGLKVIFQNKNNIFNTEMISTSRNLQLYCNYTVGVPRGSILGAYIFLIYIHDLFLVSKYLSSIMFADDTNLFYSHKSIKILFKNANNELKKISQWFKGFAHYNRKTRKNVFYFTSKALFILKKIKF